MDSSSVVRSKVTMQRGVAGDNQKRRLKEHKSEGEEADHRSNGKTKRTSVADLSGGSDSELIGNSARNQRLKKQKKTKAIDHVRGVYILCFNFSNYTYSVPNFQSNTREFILQEKEDDRGKGLMDVYQVKKAKNGVRDIKKLVSTAPHHNSVYLNVHKLEEEGVKIKINLRCHHAPCKAC